MNFLKKPKFWIVFGVILLIIVPIVVLNLLGKSSPEQAEKTETTVPVATSEASSDKANARQTPLQVTINAEKLANNYFVFEKSEYEKAKSANRPILLFFYANWCPTCAVQEPMNVATFNSINNSNVIAFRVNYNDSDTSSDEESLAKEFGVRYQHTFFTLNSNGEQVDKFLGETSSEALKDYLTKIN